VNTVHTEGISVWTVFFVAKVVKRVGCCLLLSVLIWCGTLIADRQCLNQELIRLHVVANSDSAEDQNIKLQVRDAVITSLQNDLAELSDVEAAKAYLQENLPKIRDTANRTLEQAGVDCSAVVSLCREAFDTRYYDTFSLPAGVYESLRIVIGKGQGRNWWCVTFPTLCVPVTKEGFEDTAVGAGFSDTLSHTLTGDDKYEVRFYLLDQLGRLENIFFGG